MQKKNFSGNSLVSVFWKTFAYLNDKNVCVHANVAALCNINLIRSPLLLAGINIMRGEFLSDDGADINITTIDLYNLKVWGEIILSAKLFFVLHKTSSKASERAETLTDFSRGC